MANLYCAAPLDAQVLINVKMHLKKKKKKKTFWSKWEYIHRQIHAHTHTNKRLFAAIT